MTIVEDIDGYKPMTNSEFLLSLLGFSSILHAVLQVCRANKRQMDRWGWEKVVGDFSAKSILFIGKIIRRQSFDPCPRFAQFRLSV